MGPVGGQQAGRAVRKKYEKIYLCRSSLYIKRVKLECIISVWLRKRNCYASEADPDFKFVPMHLSLYESSLRISTFKTTDPLLLLFSPSEMSTASALLTLPSDADLDEVCQILTRDGGVSEYNFG
jgi:hypothetical protein